MLLLLSALGCVPTFHTVEEACHDEVLGERYGSAEAIAFQHRADCHRRVAGLPRVPLAPVPMEAAEHHAAYNANQGISSFTEEEGQAGFTGESVFDRLYEAEYDGQEFVNTGVGEMVGSRLSLDIEQLVDQALIPSVNLREVLLQPTAEEAGYGDVDSFVDYVLLFDFPSDARVDAPVAYPNDGQREVPTSAYFYETNAAADWMVLGELRGYPLSLTFGGSTATGGWDSTDNVYEVKVERLSLTGPDGGVDVDTTLPGTGDLTVISTVGIFPRQPLEPSSEYVLRASGSSIEGTWEVEIHFATRADDTPANVDWHELMGGVATPVDLPLPSRAQRPEPF